MPEIISCRKVGTKGESNAKEKLSHDHPGSDAGGNQFTIHVPGCDHQSIWPHRPGLDLHWLEKRPPGNGYIGACLHRSRCISDHLGLIFAAGQLSQPFGYTRQTAVLGLVLPVWRCMRYFSRFLLLRAQFPL